MQPLELLENLAAAARIAVLLLIHPLIRERYNRAGATDEELAFRYPGDMRVPNPKQLYTRAITIQAPITCVWSYLVQLGQNRGGMYSYDGLENLAGCQIHTVDHVVPELQDLHVGDSIRFGAPQGYPVQKVVEIKAPTMMIWEAADAKTEEVLHVSPDSPGYVKASWGFYLVPADAFTTRLILRSRLDYANTFMMKLIWRITEVLNYVMEQKMLVTIKRLAERDAQMFRPVPV